MLQAIRDNAQGWIAWVIVGLIIITFALFGIDQYAKGDKIVVVAEVNGEEVTAGEFLTLYSRQQSRLREQFGDLYDQVVKDEQLRTEVMDALVETTVVRQWAQDNNMMISDEQLAVSIESAEVFQKDGKFDEQQYQEILLRNGLNVARFEYEQRQFLLENQNANLTMSSAFVTDAQMKQLAALQFQEREVNYLRVDQRPFNKAATITPEQVQAYYDDNKADFVTPEKVVIEYVTLSQDALAKNVPVEAAALEAFYEDNKDQFTQSEQRQASHILVRVDVAEQDEAARKKIDELAVKIKAGEDFAALAKEFSDDPGSAAMGGDLGMFQQGMMVPEFDQAVFSMKEGDVSDVIKTEFGYHIIKLVKIQPKTTSAYADVKAEVEQMLRSQEAEKQYYDLLEQLNTVAYEQSDSLIPAADAVGLEVQTSQPFAKTGGQGDVISNMKVVTAAFSDDVKKSNLNSASIELSPTASAVIRIKEIMPEAQKALDEVKAGIETELKREAGVKASADLAAKLLADSKGGQTMADMAKEGIEYHTVGWVQRENQKMLPQLSQAIFKAPKPAEGKASYSTYALPTGDSVVIEIKAVKEGAMPENPMMVTQLKQVLVQLAGTSEVEARVKTLVDAATVEIRENYKTIKPAGL